MSDTMSGWQALPDAPRDTPVCLYLPGVKYDRDDNGRPSNVQNGRCTGLWDSAQGWWIDQTTGAKVYPSQWKPIDG